MPPPGGARCSPSPRPAGMQANILDAPHSYPQFSFVHIYLMTMKRRFIQVGLILDAVYVLILTLFPLFIFINFDLFVLATFSFSPSSCFLFWDVPLVPFEW